VANKKKKTKTAAKNSVKKATAKTTKLVKMEGASKKLIKPVQKKITSEKNEKRKNEPKSAMKAKLSNVKNLKASGVKTKTSKSSSLRQSERTQTKGTQTKGSKKISFNFKEFERRVQPLADRVACVIESEEKTTASGLLIVPETVSTVEGYRPARVVACGKGARNKKGVIRPLEIKVGDRVLLPQYSGIEIEIDGVKLVLVRERELLGTQV
jgi:chaperonin GroES